MAGKKDIIIVDIEKKEIIKNIQFNAYGNLSSIYLLSNNIIIIGFWNNNIQQYEYDEIKRELKLISYIEGNNSPESGLYYINSISLFNNLIVSPYNNGLNNSSSLLIHKLKKK